jgi:hypothetical protein
MLKIALVREVPEAMKPRRIAIEVAGNDTSKSSRSRRPDGIPFKAVKLPVRGVAARR